MTYIKIHKDGQSSGALEVLDTRNSLNLSSYSYTVLDRTTGEFSEIEIKGDSATVFNNHGMFAGYTATFHISQREELKS